MSIIPVTLPTSPTMFQTPLAVSQALNLMEVTSTNEAVGIHFNANEKALVFDGIPGLTHENDVAENYPDCSNRLFSFTQDQFDEYKKRHTTDGHKVVPGERRLQLDLSNHTQGPRLLLTYPLERSDVSSDLSLNPNASLLDLSQPQTHKFIALLRSDEQTDQLPFSVPLLEGLILFFNALETSACADPSKAALLTQLASARATILQAGAAYLEKEIDIFESDKGKSLTQPERALLKKLRGRETAIKKHLIAIKEIPDLNTQDVVKKLNQSLEALANLIRELQIKMREKPDVYKQRLTQLRAFILQLRRG